MLTYVLCLQLFAEYQIDTSYLLFIACNLCFSVQEFYFRSMKFVWFLQHYSDRMIILLVFQMFFNGCSFCSLSNGCILERDGKWYWLGMLLSRLQCCQVMLFYYFILLLSSFGYDLMEKPKYEISILKICTYCYYRFKSFNFIHNVP